MHKALLASTALASMGAIMAMATPEEALENLRARREQLVNESQAILDRADAADGDISDADLATIENNRTEVENIDKRITAREAFQPQGQGRKTQPEPKNARSSDSRVQVAPTNRGTGGFRNFGEFAQCVKDAQLNDVAAAEKLKNAATTYSTEGTGADGGFAVPPDFRRDIAVKVFGEGSLVDRTDRLTSNGNSIYLPKDETAPWQSSGGIQSYWEGEGQSHTESKLSLGSNQLRLNKLVTMVKASDELLGDAALLDSYLRAKAPMKMQAKVNSAIIDGSGTGMPLGILRSTALITVGKNASQPADSIWFENITKMDARLYSNNPGACVWLINQEILPQLQGLAFDPQATSKVPVWLPANSLSQSPYSTLLGKPVIPVQACKKLGDKGDIILADMSQYLTVTKGQDIRTDVSIHLHFDQDITTYKFVMRLAGQPWWENPITPENATDTLSGFVALEAR